jgi:glycine cleavage system H protein
MTNIPKDLKYTKSDEWIRVEGGAAVMGISDYAQSQLSDIVYVEVLAKVESVKAASEVYRPAGGTVTEINPALSATPELVNQDPYGAGWMVKFALASSTELDPLMDSKTYEAYCAGRQH